MIDEVFEVLKNNEEIYMDVSNIYKQLPVTCNKIVVYRAVKRLTRYPGIKTKLVTGTSGTGGIRSLYAYFPEED